MPRGGAPLAQIWGYPLPIYLANLSTYVLAGYWTAFSDPGLPSRTILDRTYSAQRFFIFS